MSLIRRMARPNPGSPFRAPYVKNSINMPSRVTTTCENYTYLSGLAGSLQAKSVYGGTNSGDLTDHQQVSNTGVVTVGSDIPCTQLWSQVFGTTTAELTGISFDRNPNGLTQFEESFQYMRVKYVDLTFEFRNAANVEAGVTFWVLFYRPDEGLPSFTLGNTGAVPMTDINLIPHMVQMTWKPNKGDIAIEKSNYKRVRIDPRKMYNDLEWSYDSVTSGNFWVQKNTTNGTALYTDAPAAPILCRIYGIVSDPGEQATAHSFHVGVHAKWTVEFDRGDQVLPAGST